MEKLAPCRRRMELDRTGMGGAGARVGRLARLWAGRPWSPVSLRAPPSLQAEAEPSWVSPVSGASPLWKTY